jgi:hypothetical protein
VSFAVGLFVLVRHGRAGGQRRTEGFARGRFGRRPLGSVAVVGLCAALGIAAVFLAVLTTGLHDSGARSSEVQQRGVRDPGIVLGVKVGTYTRFSKNYGFRTTVTSTVVAVQLDHPIRGAAQTTVHSPRAVALRVGAPVTVLVDRKDPSYAEFPGKPLHSSWGWVVLLVGSVAAWAALAAWALTAGGTRGARAE